MPAIRAAKKAAEPETPPEDTFVTKLQAAIESMLEDDTLEPKEKTAVIANAIKFLAVRNKTATGDDGSFWGDGD